MTIIELDLKLAELRKKWLEFSEKRSTIENQAKLLSFAKEKLLKNNPQPKLL